MIKLLKKINIKSIAESIKKDFKLKLISLAVGVVMWFLVIGGVNPVVTRQFNDVPISFKNQSVPDSKKLVRISPENPTVTVTITGKRSDVYSVNKSDIVAEVNMQNAIYSGSHRLSINYKVPYNVQFKSASENDLLVTLDEEINKTYKVEVETVGQIKNKNQVVAIKEPADSEVTVSGPVSYVNKVKKVVCVVDVTNKDSDEVVQSKIIPVDESNQEVKKVHISKTDTNVSIGFKNFKEVPIKLVEINSAPSDVKILKKNIVPNVVSIVGNLTSLEQISEINTKPFDLSQIKESGSYSLNLELPSDVTLVNNDLRVVINIDVDKKIEKTIEVDTSNIVIENETGKAVILKGLQDKVKVTVKGYESDLANLSADLIELYVSIKKDDIGKNVQIKAKNIENIEIVKISNDIVQAIEK
ncbi:CdaR family protein [Parvimonas sp. G1425]|uniref:CdaR family protein n=1 Tax=Parvimonas sp. G1425 TaxID=3387694 RepID=UPI0039E2DDAC